MPASEPFDDFEIDLGPLWPEEDGRLEPIFFDGPQWIEFPEVEPHAALLELAADAALLVERDEFSLFEPEEGDGELEEPPLPGPQPTSATSLAASLGVHVLPLLLLLLVGLHGSVADVAAAIPVQLVLETPAAIAEDKAAGESDEQNSSRPPPSENNNKAAPTEPAPAPPAPPPTRVASAVPPAKPRPPAPRMQPTAARARIAPPPRAAGPPVPSKTEAPPPPKSESTPPPRAEAAAAPPVPAAAAAPSRPAVVPVAAPASASSAVSSAAPSAATGDGDYFSRLEELTRPYLYMLSPSFLAGRRGRTTLSIIVADDGTIGSIGVKRSSGYPDIDARIEQMVAAVGRFPPLPPQLRRPGADLDFNLVFPQVLQQ